MPVACIISAPQRDFDLIALATTLPLHGQARSPAKALQREFFRLVFHTELRCSAINVRREWVEKTSPENEHEHSRSFISSLPPDQGVRLGQAVRGHWSVENKNHHKRDHHVWQEDRHRHRRVNVAQNLALTRNALLAIIPFDEKRNLPSLIVDYQDSQTISHRSHLKSSSVPMTSPAKRPAGKWGLIQFNL